LRQGERASAPFLLRVRVKTMNRTESVRLLALLSIVVGSSAVHATGLVVNITGGQISGVTEGSVRAFRGIPYAAPPVNDLRWRNPQPVQPWNGVKAASSYGSQCLQYPNPASLPGSEDCLFLNVHSPTAAESPLPVVLWIHGGSFQTGNGNYNGTPLVEFSKGAVVMVAINYRLNIYGFLASSDGAPAGNYGLMDQRAALEWVRDNIGAFNGDPTRVTIMGESAGGMSVSLHLAMPGSWGLFHAAIIQSGSFLIINAISGSDATQVWDATVVASGCGSSAQQLQCMLAKNTSEITTMLQSFSPPNIGITPWIKDLGLVFQPVVDGSELSDYPWTLVGQQKVANVPVLQGTNQDEASLFLQVSQDSSVDDFHSFVDLNFGSSAQRTLDELYVLNYSLPCISDTSTGYCAIERSGTDLLMACAAHHSTESIASRQSTWQYYLAPNSSVYGIDHGLGIYHGFDVPLLFGDQLPGLFPAGVPTPIQQLADAMQSYWLNFVISQNPNGNNYRDNQTLPVWPSGDGSDEVVQLYLDLPTSPGAGIRAVRGLKHPECDFMIPWVNSNLFPPTNSYKLTASANIYK